jgi:DNA/RNA-binding domain of Phe-tRNA-synthetase-like protein
VIGDEDANLGWVDPSVAAEFPELRLWWLAIDEVGPARSPGALKERLRDLSDRYRGPQALLIRQQPIPHAYRVFYRHIGLDPDVERVPIEALVVERLRHGGFRSGTALEDAVTVAVMETSVPVWAIDARAARPPLGIRQAADREQLGRRDDRAPWLPGGRLVVTDAEGPVAVLFGDVAPGHAVGQDTHEAVVFSVQVAGVPDIHVSEALWTVADTLEGL